jgi:hypothetical protein
MAEEKITSRIEIGGEFGEKVMSEIGSLREELVTIRQLLERGHSIDRAIEEYRFLPSNIEKPIRWGYIGVWGKGGSNLAYSIITLPENEYFDKPQGCDENIAAFAKAFTNPNTIKVCKYLFRNGEHSRESIMKACQLSDEELDAAVKPLLEWHFAEWKDRSLESVDHGIYYVVTLVGMVQVAFDNKIRREQK